MVMVFSQFKFFLALRKVQGTRGFHFDPSILVFDTFRVVVTAVWQLENFGIELFLSP